MLQCSAWKPFLRFDALSYLSSLICSESEGAHQNLLLLDLSSSGSAYNKRTTIMNSQGDEKNSPSELPIFSFSSIAACTDNFSITNKLGEGGFGPVYKVMLVKHA